MRAAAKVGKFPGTINRNLFIGLGELLDEMALHEIALFFELCQTLIARQKLACIRNILLHQFLHLLLNLFQIVGSKWSRTIEIVEESALSRRPVPKLGLREKLQHRRSEKMRRRMTINFESFGISVSKQTKLGILFQRLRKINQISVSLRRESRIGQPRTDRFRDIECGRTRRNFLNAPIRELHMYAVCHSLEA